MTLVRSIARGAGVHTFVDRGSFGPDYPFVEGPGGWEFALTQLQTLIGNKEYIGADYLSYVRQALKGNPIIFAAVMNRLGLFRQARFKYRRLVGGRPGELFGTPDLEPLEKPWPGGSTGDLLALMEIHETCAGNFFATKLPDGRVKPMRPDWTVMVLGSDQEEDINPYDLEAEVVAYLYYEGGRGFVAGDEPRLLLPEDVAHYMPVPDPEAPYRGMSWLTPAIRELLADKAMTEHRKKFLEGGATPNLAVKLNVTDLGEFNKWVARYKEEREGAGVDINPYRTLFLAAAADPVPIGVDLKAIDFANVQSAGEVRIAAAAQVHPAVAAFSAGLQGSTLNAGNLEAAFRQFANGTIRWRWGAAAEAFRPIVAEQPGAELWYDDRDIPALQEDTLKAADITSAEAETINTLIMAGFDPDAVVDAVTSGDLTRLSGKHSGLPSVQLQSSGSASGNGNGNAAGNQRDKRAQRDASRA